MRTQAFFIITLAGLAFLAACGKDKTVAEPDGTAVTVQVSEARYQTVPAIIEAPGTVQPRNRIALASQINGFVREMRVRAGDRVTKEQILAILDARDAESQKAAAESAVTEAQAALSEARRAYQAALDIRNASKASVELANQTYARYQKLFESKSVSPQEMDEVRSRRDAAQADLASRESMVAAAEDRINQVEARISQAKAQAGRVDVLLSYTRIQAPESGIVVDRSVDAGGAIFPGSPLLVIETTGRPQVLASLPAENAANLKAGMQLQLRQSEYGPFLEGRIAEIIPQSDPATHSVQFKVDLPENARVVHGQYMKIAVPVGTREAILIDRNAVRTEGQLTGIFIIDGGKRARFRLVKTVPFNADQLEILSGIGQGETIILNPDDRITDGMPVETES